MNPVELHRKVRIPGEVIFQKVGEEIVLLNLETGMYYGLDSVGTRIWELLVEKGKLEAVLDQMAEEYEVNRVNLERDILHLIKELNAKGLVEVGEQ